MSQVNLTLKNPGDLIQAADSNANFSAFGVPVDGSNIATDTFEKYHLSSGSPQAPLYYASGIVENPSYSIGSYVANGTSQLINHGTTALQIAGPITLPNNCILFVNWKQHIVDWQVYAGPGPAATPQDLVSHFYLKANINGGGSADLIPSFVQWVSGYNHQNSAVPGYEFDSNAITVAGCLAYENTSGLNKTITDIQLEVAPNDIGAGNVDFRIRLGQGLISYFILRM